MLRQEDHLFFGFTQRCRLGVAVVFFYMAAGETDLTRVLGQSLGALGKQNRYALFTQDQRHQHGCRCQRAFRVHAGVQVMIAANDFRIWRMAGNFMADKTLVHRYQCASISCMLPIGKKCPFDHTPYM